MTGDEQVLGDVVLLEVVGRGAHSTVHRGRRRDRAGHIVAVKRLDRTAPADALARLRREAGALDALAHPAIVPLLDVVDDPDGGVALVLPYAAGGSLEDLLQRHGRLDWPTVADIGARLASALSAAHGAGVLHRDVKPANVLIGTEDEARLADFGTVALHEAAADGPAVGTAEYVDPAVVVDGVPPSPRSDLYSLGVVLYRALAGQLPYAGGSPDATVAAADRAVHSPLGDLIDDAPAELVDAVERAMARDPGDRHGAVQQLQVQLEALVLQHEQARLSDLAGQLDRLGPGAAGPGLRRTTSVGEVADDAAAPEAPPPPPPPADASPERPAASSPGDSGTRLFGPRPPRRPDDAPAPARSRWGAALVAVLVAVPLVAAGGAFWWARRDATPTATPSLSPTTSASTPPSAPRTPAPRCDGAAAPEGDEGDAVLDADVDGRGCSLPVVVSREPVEGDPTLVIMLPEEAGELAGRYAIGGGEDQALVGDWDCDGTDTPAIVRGVDGQVFLYDGYGRLDPAAGPALDPGAPGVVVTDDGGCDEVAAAP